MPNRSWPTGLPVHLLLAALCVATPAAAQTPPAAQTPDASQAPAQPAASPAPAQAPATTPAPPAQAPAPVPPPDAAETQPPPSTGTPVTAQPAAPPAPPAAAQAPAAAETPAAATPSPVPPAAAAAQPQAPSSPLAERPADLPEWLRAREATLVPVNVYADSTADHLSGAVAGMPERVYVPNLNSDNVYVIDPATLKVVDRFGVGRSPQHIVPSWDLQTLWVTGSAKSRTIWGSLSAIDPRSGKLTERLPMEDAYNMYFTPDGASAIIVAESRRRLEYRDPHTMKLQGSLTIPACAGLNHADFSADGSTAIFTCEFSGAVAKIDVAGRKLLGLLRLKGGGMPQDIRISPDGKVFFVANMMTDGLSVIDADSFTEIGFIPTGKGTHGLYPSRDGTKLYVANRGSHLVGGPPHGPGSVSVIDFATRKVEATWPIPGGGSPDMGNVSADGRHLWLSGRFDDVVYCIDTADGTMTKIPVGRTPHGLTIWPQPGRYSLGHTGVMR